MSRIEFGGHGGPIPDIAIPDPNLSSDLPIQALELLDGTSFEKADWVALGYTHYEVWCIGGAGGRGADVIAGVNWLRSTHQEVAPPDIWAQVLASYEQTARGSNVTVYSGTAPAGTPQPPVGVVEWHVYPDGGILWTVTPAGLAEMQNPAHTFTIWEYHDPYITGAQAVAGGGGGGGGLHVVSGSLDDLPDSVPVAVGAVGVDAPPAQIQVNGPWDPTPPPSTSALENWAVRYTRPSPILFPVPQGGGDGGVSSFGDIGIASGGKGGDPAVVWVGGNKMFRANGGQGGKGGQTAAGGGGLGSVSSTASGQDGGWDGTVGSGGGGGRGGMVGITPPPGPGFGF